jgi:hypothetical protein
VSESLFLTGSEDHAVTVAANRLPVTWEKLSVIVSPSILAVVGVGIKALSKWLRLKWES